ncbi:MAG: DUF167 domain-containing protein [Thermodesulfovibrionales bacterium]|nr:DUF167 domain-containing protein [Thermodesulfovibrionales bacterium]
MKIPFTKSKKGITIKVRVEPRSSRRGITGLTAGTLKVKVHAPPVDGSANEELREILSEEFRIRKSAITVIKGISSKDKLVEIAGIDALP